jgi:hypothetical protein
VPKSDKFGANRAAFVYQGPFKKEFSTGFRVVNEVVLEEVLRRRSLRR